MNKKVSPNSEDLIFELKPIKRKPKKITIKGINVFIEEEILIELDGNYVNYAEYKKYAQEKIKEKIHTIDELKEIWLDNNKRKELLEKLKKEHIEIDLIKEIEKMEDFDSFDIIARIVFNAPLITKDERIKHFINKHISEIDKYGEDIKEITLLILEKYKHGSIEDISPSVFRTPDMERYSALSKFKRKFGIQNIPKFFEKMKRSIYEIRQ